MADQNTEERIKRIEERIKNEYSGYRFRDLKPLMMGDIWFLLDKLKEYNKIEENIKDDYL